MVVRDDQAIQTMVRLLGERQRSMEGRKTVGLDGGRGRTWQLGPVI